MVFRKRVSGLRDAAGQMAVAVQGGNCAAPGVRHALRIRSTPRPPGHTVKVGKDAEVILFSPQDEHSKVIDHMLNRMAG
ncbi:hypothetical protein [Sulfuriferula multivorans]|uniref:hypothetical protein n=1 Tax=Sulfuriferula multivorans TaxID=1559896 RepID=UPI000F5BBEAB|nr:hypothetical protein [Sulfuriferula multivorans]